MNGRRAPRPDAILLVAAVWAWALSGAYFWGLAEEVGAVLPYVPAAVWAGPGMLWRLAPGVLIAALVLTTLFVLWRSQHLRPLRPLSIAAIVVVALVAFVWGAALLGAGRQTAHG